MPQQLRAQVDEAVRREDWATAAAGLRQLALVPPQSARLWLELSYAESFLGHYRAARAAAGRAKGLPLHTRDDVADLIARLRTFNDAEGVRKVARGLLEAPRADAGLLATSAVQLSNLNDHALAFECAGRAVAIDPSSIAARMARGQMRAQHGDIPGAEDDFNWCVRRIPGLMPAWWALSRLRRQTVESNHAGELRMLLSRVGLGAADVAYGAFALHKELDDLGDVAGAWQALQQGCTAKRSMLRYDAADTRALIDALLEAPCPPRPSTACTEESVPIFIVGMHRSGTTLLEQLLDASGQVLGVGELYDFTSALREATDHHCRGVIDRVVVARAGQVNLPEVGRRYMAGVAWRLGGMRFFTDKLPSNFLNTGFICRALPQAKILHLVRNPLETCFSNLRELFSDANPYSYDQQELADYFLQYRRLMSHWHGMFPGRILDVSYSRLVQDPEATMREVAAFCGIEYRDSMRDPRSSRRSVATASAVQVREGVVRRERPKWEPYAAYLHPLIDALRAGGVDVPDRES
ncbi:sulfotransferase [Thermomonas sp. LB-4]|uniref:tetratricopeptide repeat-containing sulfotransferase family protein n=1 Tax=Thermomonas sp. LB-4 TaxID=3102790 RepID=UPI002EDA6527